MGKRASEAQVYDSDDGFVEDAPKSKKAKLEKKSTPKSKASSGDHTGKGKDGNDFWEISNARRIGISEYKGNTMVDIREYYEKNGEKLPGKKGISLTLDQFNIVMGCLPQIHAAIAAKGLEVVRPDFDAPIPKQEESEEEAEAEGEDEDEDSDD